MGKKKFLKKKPRSHLAAAGREHSSRNEDLFPFQAGLIHSTTSHPLFSLSVRCPMGNTHISGIRQSPHQDKHAVAAALPCRTRAGVKVNAATFIM